MNLSLKKQFNQNFVNTHYKMSALILCIFSFGLLPSSNLEAAFSQPLKFQELALANSISHNISYNNYPSKYIGKWVNKNHSNFEIDFDKSIGKQSFKIPDAVSTELFTPIPLSSSNDFQNSESFLANYSGRPDQPIDWSEGEELRENEDFDESSQDYKSLYRNRAGPQSLIILPQFLTEHISKAVLLDILHPFLRNTPPPALS